MSINSAGAVAKTVANLVKSIPVRNKDVVSRRFGLKNGKKETLESIGKSYGITRERVRQIEEFAVNQLRKVADENQDVERYVALTKNIIDRVPWRAKAPPGDHSESGNGVMKERDLFKAFSGSGADSAVNSSLVFVLSLSRDLVRFSENDDFHTFWAVSSGALNNFKNLASECVSFLEKSGRPVLENDFTPLAGKPTTFLSISKAVGKNIFHEVGLVSWPEVKPKGVRDKAYLVLKKDNAPKHFGEIAKLINTSGFNGKKANTQTVHNELIKDSRFILVGRGTYALSDWGYKAGTVKDVLVDLLRSSSKPIAKAALVSKVLDSRMVKENTILLNLQDSKIFIKNENGTYSLRKA